LETILRIVLPPAAAGGYAQFHNSLWWNFSNVGASTNNTLTGLGNNNLATNWFADVTLTNQIANPSVSFKLSQRGRRSSCKSRLEIRRRAAQFMPRMRAWWNWQTRQT
jgi:hypothetical protein